MYIVHPVLCCSSAHVLLDLSFRAKVTHFGLARNIQQAEETRTARVVGTSGYIPPEYYRGVITTKMDAFGFGVVSGVCIHAKVKVRRMY
jgi:interleukin-1 receptor-associated kinase 4